MMMPSSRDLLMLFISLELVSAPGFLMAAFRKSDPRSNEAGLKFFLIGVLSTAVMLYGMSLIYGLTGTTRLDGDRARRWPVSAARRETSALAAILFVVVGFAFKVSAVPFQFWAPDTYEGAPVPVAAFLSVASRAAGFAGLLQLMFVAFIHQHDVLGADLRGALGAHDDAREPGGAAADGRWCGCSRTRGSRRPGTSCCRSRWCRANAAVNRKAFPACRRLHPDLRDHEHRRVRGGDRRQPSASRSC